MPLDQLKSVGHILSDPTRIDTLRLVVGSAEPVSAVDVANAFGLHPNAARHHLAKLEGLGLVRSIVRRNPSGGRPAKLYTGGSQRVDLQFPARQFLMFSGIILDAIKDLGLDLADAVVAAGKSCGRSVGCAPIESPESSAGTAAHLDIANAVIDSCTSFGCDMRIAASDQHGVLVQARNCIFHELAAKSNGLTCALCEGLLAGIAESAGFELFLSYNKRLAHGDDMCSTTMRFQPCSPTSINN